MTKQHDLTTFQALWIIIPSVYIVNQSTTRATSSLHMSGFPCIRLVLTISVLSYSSFLIKDHISRISVEVQEIGIYVLGFP